MAKIKVKTLTDNKGENFYPLTHGTAVVNDQGVNMEDRMTHVEDTVEQKSKEQAEFFEATDARVSETEGQVAQFESNVTQEVADLKQAQNEFYATTNTRVQSFEDDVEARLAEKAKIGVVDETGDSNEYVMSQAAVTRELTELEQEVGNIIKQELVGEDTLLWINANGELNTTLPDAYGSKKYNIDGINGVVEVSTPLEGNEVVSLYTILDSQGRTITHGDTTNISSKAVINLDNWPSAKELYVAFSVSNKNTSAAIKYDFKDIVEKQKEENKKLFLKDEELVRANSEIKGQILDLKEIYYDAKEQYIPIVEGNVFNKGEFYEVYNAGQSFRNKTSETILFNTITFALKSSSDTDVLRIFKVSKNIWNDIGYTTNKQFTDTTIFTKLYESKFVNNGKDRTIQLADIISLAPDESIFVVLFGVKKTFALRTTTFEQGSKSFGYPIVFSLSAEVNGDIGCYYGYDSYSSYPINLSLRAPYVLKKDAYNGRTKIHISASDNEISILHKMIDAYNSGDCDVYFEKGEYVFSEIYPYMQNVLGWTWDNGRGLPIGNGCRYYFNNSTLISNPIDGYTTTRNILDSVPMAASSYELHDALLICNGGTYCVHDEGNAKDAAYIHLYKNMRMRYDAQGIGTGGCIGAGTGYNAVVKIEDCYFWTNKENGYPIGIHGVVNNPNNKSVDFTLYCSNSYFNQASISFNVFDATRDNVFVQFNNNRTTLDFDGKSGLKTVIMWNNTKS